MTKSKTLFNLLHHLIIIENMNNGLNRAFFHSSIGKICKPRKYNRKYIYFLHYKDLMKIKLAINHKSLPSSVR